mgnify:CR=1 FL=1
MEGVSGSDDPVPVQLLDLCEEVIEQVLQQFSFMLAQHWAEAFDLTRGFREARQHAGNHQRVTEHGVVDRDEVSPRTELSVDEGIRHVLQREVGSAGCLALRLHLVTGQRPTRH